MKRNHYDAIVIGLGAMGSAAVYQLAKAGASVLGVDRYSPPHALGSSHGDTRITRMAIGEGAEYMPLVVRSSVLWRQIEDQASVELYTRCGGLILSESGAGQHGIRDFVKQTAAIADRYGVEHEVLAVEGMHTRFPQLKLSGQETGYFEPAAGYLRPERCVRAQLDLARGHGAVLHTDERVLSYDSDEHSVTVRTDRNEYSARKVVMTAGPWMKELVPEHANVFKTYRQVLYWYAFEDESSYTLYEKAPVTIWLFGNAGNEQVYAFPAIDGFQGGIKFASEDYEDEILPATMRRDVGEVETALMYDRCIKGRFTGISRKCIKAISCIYTVTPDSKFIIDFHPQHKNVIIASPCSGHGFKHSAAIGEVLAQMVHRGTSDIDIRKFGLERFAA